MSSMDINSEGIVHGNQFQLRNGKTPLGNLAGGNYGPARCTAAQNILPVKQRRDSLASMYFCNCIYQGLRHEAYQRNFNILQLL